MSKFYKLLNLPLIPDHLWPDINILNKNVEPLWHNQPRTAIKDNNIISQDQYARFEISKNLLEWVDKNIRDDYVNIGLSYMYDGSINLPHTDFTRDVTLIYLFDTGGSDVKTNFWKFKDGDTYQANGCTPTSYDDLELLDSVVLEPYLWTILESTVLHSVEGKTRPRISLQLGFNKDNTWVCDVLGVNNLSQ